MLTTGGVWQNASDVNRKHLFEDVQGEDILAKLRTIPIRRWGYRSEADEVRHLGPTAQDFYAAFGLGSDERSIGTVDADGVALAAVQALDTRTREQAAALEKLKQENTDLHERLQALEQHVGRNKADLPLTILLVTGGMVLGVLLMRRHKAAITQS